MDGWLGVVIMMGLGLAFAGTMIGLSALLGPRNPTPKSWPPTSAACRRSAMPANAIRSSSIWWR